MEILNREVTGFECEESHIEIFDDSGKTFYLYHNPSEKLILFNLPCGIFFTENNVEKRKKPLRYVCPELPKPDKKIIPKEMNFRVTDNPSKASIDVKTGDVIIDYSIDEKERPFKCFVLLHEVGHNYYNGGTHEHFCDIFAAKMMLEKFGFNPSQVYLAQEFCLSERSINRKDFLYDYLNRVKRYA